jgi:two-component system, cell cycle response regulator
MGIELDIQNAARTERALILLLDDNLEGRDALVQVLEGPFEVLCAGRGQEGIQLARERSPDLVLMDVVNPDEDGFFALRELVAHPGTRHAPVIILSAATDEEAQVRSLEMGAADYLAKPIAARVLVARLERALRESRERQALHAMAQTDALTGLSNFRALSTRLDQELKRSSRYGYALSAVMIDLDNLKVINDRFGHEVGNRAIVAVASHLRANLREVDFAARYGGDEFVVLLPHQTAAEAAVFADRLRVGLGPISVPGRDRLPIQLTLTTSVGIAEHRPDLGHRAHVDLLEAADGALYEAKRRGRDRTVIHCRKVQGARRRAEQRH